MISCSRIRVSLYRLLYYYYYLVRRNVARFTSENLRKCSVTIPELCKAACKITRLEASVMNVILRQWKCLSIYRNREIT
jgi:hypothetical protein